MDPSPSAEQLNARTGRIVPPGFARSSFQVVSTPSSRLARAQIEHIAGVANAAGAEGTMAATRSPAFSAFLQPGAGLNPNTILHPNRGWRI
jgi:hypothetical protein